MEKQMQLLEERQRHLAAVLAQLVLPPGIEIRVWREADFAVVQRLSYAEGWTTPILRSADSLRGWQSSWPTLVAVEGDEVVGFVRGLTDGFISMFLAELLVDVRVRGRGIGRALLDVCHGLYPTARIDLLAEDDARAFYKACGFRVAYDGMRKSYV